MVPQSPLLTALQKDGYVIIPALLPPNDLTRLREAARRTTDLARRGTWPYVRTLPRQVPPWPTSTPSSPPKDGIWGVQGLLNPSLPDHEVFTKNYFSSTILDVVKELLQCGNGDLVMELFNLLVRPDTDFELRWHRDDIPSSASAEEELSRLAIPAFHAQWNLALYDDSSLVVVPRSHARARTDVERTAGPFEKELPGMEVVKLRAGDVVFYDSNILHRGVYSCAVERATLHGSVGHVQGSDVRARNVLQHGVGEWVEKCDFSCLQDDKERERAEGMRRWLVEMGRSTGGGDLGYSLDG
jgi:Phytanoyl-CoA dioxygenase (PhyH)